MDSWYESFADTQRDQLFLFNTTNYQTCTFDTYQTLAGTITPGHNGPGGNVDKTLFKLPQNIRSGVSIPD